MIKKILTGFCLFSAVVTFAQQGTSSPYSNFGIGEVRSKGTIEARSMAGIAVEQDSIHINLENPASFASLKLTSFSVGGTSNNSVLKTNASSESTTRSTLDYLVLGIPMGKFGLGFGLMPNSSVGYSIKKTAVLETDRSITQTGTGGLNKLFLGLGYKVTPKLSVGADLSYNFGNVETTYLESISNVESGSSETNTAKLSGLSYNMGLQYQTKITKKLMLFSALNYTFANKLSSVNTRIIKISSQELADPIADSYIPFLARTNVSIGVGQLKKWQLATKFVYQAASDLSNHYNKTANVTYNAFSSYSFGGYYIPDYNSYTNYFKRMVYRAGLRYEKTGLVVNTKSIEDMGLTFGLGFPITGSFSSLNVGLEMGKRGTTSNGLVQQNYANISIGLSFNDKWFEKRKFN